MKFLNFKKIVLTLIIFTSFSAHAYWDKGHSAICQLAIDNLSEEPLLKPHQDLIIDDVENISHEFLKKNNISEIVHLAAKKNVKDSFYNLDNSVENYEMTLKLYDSAIKAGVQKIYLASTCEIFGYQEKPLSEKFNFKPHLYMFN